MHLAPPDRLACGRCRRRFLLRDGIPELFPLPSPESPSAGEWVLRERAQRDREAAAYDRLLGLRLFSAVEIPRTLVPLAVGPDARVVEAGCGTGRITLHLARHGAQVIAVDHSIESLYRLRAKLGAGGDASIQLVQADAGCLPILTGWATRAVSAQVLEHLPEAALREQAVCELARVLYPGGRLAISAYWHAPLLRRLLPREGRHSGEIFFHRFERDELLGLLTPHFRVDRVTRRLLYVLLAHATRQEDAPPGAV